MRTGIVVELYIDVVCPICPIGTKHLESALGAFEHGDKLDIVFRSRRLQPGVAVHSVDEYIARKHQGSPKGPIIARLKEMAAAEGLEYNMEDTQAGNTVDAHRLFHFARTRGRQAAMVARLYSAHFTDRENIFDQATLVRLAAEVGLDEVEARNVLSGHDFLPDVEADENRARRCGVEWVPYMVIDGRFGIGASQPQSDLLEALRTCWTDQSAVNVAVDEGTLWPGRIPHEVAQ